MMLLFMAGALTGAYLIWMLHLWLSVKTDIEFLAIYRRQTDIIQKQAEELSKRDHADWWKGE